MSTPSRCHAAASATAYTYVRRRLVTSDAAISSKRRRPSTAPRRSASIASAGGGRRQSASPWEKAAARNPHPLARVPSFQVGRWLEPTHWDYVCEAAHDEGDGEGLHGSGVRCGSFGGGGRHQYFLSMGW